MLFLDTDVLIAFGRRDGRVFERIARLSAGGEVLAVTSINAAEFLRGIAGAPADVAVANRILDGLVEVPFGPRASRRYGRMMHALDRAGARLPDVDGIIAAVVLEAGGRIMTGNARHFGRVAGLELVPLREPDR